MFCLKNGEVILSTSVKSKIYKIASQPFNDKNIAVASNLAISFITLSDNFVHSNLTTQGYQCTDLEWSKDGKELYTTWDDGNLRVYKVK